MAGFLHKLAAFSRLILPHRGGDQWVDVHTSRSMAERIPRARVVELPGDDHRPFFGDQDAVVALTQEFLTGPCRSPIPTAYWPPWCSLGGVRDAPCAGQTLLTLTEHGAFFDKLDSPARRGQGTRLLLDALTSIRRADAEAG